MRKGADHRFFKIDRILYMRIGVDIAILIFVPKMNIHLYIIAESARHVELAVPSAASISFTRPIYSFSVSFRLREHHPHMVVCACGRPAVGNGEVQSVLL